ncbi:MAG TPA: TraB/GumN family protein [Candidatus Kapabacteria bacterium]|nr:TraB/GumN family protein [Candidatus Kapabacteria bacterium]
MMLRRRAGMIAAAMAQLLLATSGHAQGTAGKNMLWRVQSDSTVVYILGSVHMLPKSMYPLNAPIERAFDSAQRVVFELNLDSISQAAPAMEMVMKGMYTDGRTLKSVLSRSTYKLAARKLKKMGMDISMFERFKPWMVGITMMGLDAQDDGYEPQYGIDFYFHKKANDAKKPVAGLETLNDQISIFSDLPDKAQEGFLLQMMDSRQGSDELDQIVKAWKLGDTTPLEKMLSKYLVKDSDLYESMLFRRNRNWIPQIESMLNRKERTMVVVGSLHLVGDRGVIAMLRQKGYRIEQL